jgi:hypothetical protein
MADEYIKEMAMFMDKCNGDEDEKNAFSLNPDEEDTLINKKDN